MITYPEVDSDKFERLARIEKWSLVACFIILAFCVASICFGIWII
jgi:hypothetical protein